MEKADSAFFKQPLNDVCSIRRTKGELRFASHLHPHILPYPRNRSASKVEEVPCV